MAVADRSGLPVAVIAESASPHEVKLAGKTVDAKFVCGKIERLIGDMAYDSDKLDAEMRENFGIDMISPHRENRKKKKTQDGRKLRRYGRRWKVERLFAWLQNFRKILVRYEMKIRNYPGFIHLGCIVILLRQIL